jgi:hypothetical protein
MAGQFRAIWCEQYEACLDFAARENWASFSCKRCKLRKLAVRPSATAYAHERSQFDPRCGVSVNHVVGKSAWRHR